DAAGVGFRPVAGRRRRAPLRPLTADLVAVLPFEDDGDDVPVFAVEQAHGAARDAVSGSGCVLRKAGSGRSGVPGTAARISQPASVTRLPQPDNTRPSSSGPASPDRAASVARQTPASRCCPTRRR